MILLIFIFNLPLAFMFSASFHFSQPDFILSQHSFFSARFHLKPAFIFLSQISFEASIHFSQPAVVVFFPTNFHFLNQLSFFQPAFVRFFPTNCIFMLPQNFRGSIIIVATLSVCPSIRFQVITLLFVVGLKYCLAQMIVITR